MTPVRPALSFIAKGRPALVMTCRDTDMQVQVRGLLALQAWPQPVLTLEFGATQQSRRPNLALVGNQTAFSIGSPIRDAMLDAIDAGLPISANFDGITRNFPVPSEEMRRNFSTGCAALARRAMGSS